KLERLRNALSGNSPVTPDGWVMVPKEPTQAMIKAWLSEIANFRGHAAGYRAALEAAPQEVNRG
ncbi:eaa protein, partial [Escherichia coli]|nr:eaa protein [Escherichia coli]EFE6126631.1 eaa protein [Escherichia coli]EFI7293771.1 eaa protein [Escherichia coli]EGZ1622028.1 eaa protein [Escherichia coli]